MRPATRVVRWQGCDLHYDEVGEGVPVLLIHPSGATASTWGRLADGLTPLGRVITYDRRGYARSGGRPAHSLATHTGDAAAILDRVGAAPAVVFGVSAGAVIAIDLAVRRPGLVRAVVAHEAPWRATRHLPPVRQVPSLARIGWLTLRGRPADAAEVLLRTAYAYEGGGSAWDAFPEAWRQAARENARPALWDFRISVGDYPSRADLAAVAVPVTCTYGARSSSWMADLVARLAAAIPTARLRCIDGAAHAAPFDATDAVVQLIGEAVTETRGAASRSTGGAAVRGRPAVR